MAASAGFRFFEHVPLRRRTTFGIAAQARFLAEADTEAGLGALLRTVTARVLPLLVLGGGSNIVFRQDFPGLVVCPRLRGVRSWVAPGDRVVVEAGAGESWHDFVQYCLAQGWYGLENLSLIPGTVGAAPIQNIGAYGVEIRDCFHSLRALCRRTGMTREFSLTECDFGYRDSVFKHQFKDRYIITRVRFTLSRRPHVTLQYGDIAAELDRQQVRVPHPRDVARAVIAIRRRKLPDPADIGNAGSFFKNPVVSVAHYERLKLQYPDIIAYPQATGVKLAAGWLIERAGWKGRSLGQAGVYERQALVLVNRGHVKGEEVALLARTIQDDVQARFGVALEIEVNIVQA